MRARLPLSADRPALRRLMAALLAVALTACVPPEWMVPPDEPGGQKARVSYTVNKKAFKHLDRAQKAMNEKDFEAAKEELEDMQSRARRFNPYELALMHRTWAQYHIEQEQMPQAAAALEAALEGETLPEGDLIDTMYNLGSLQLATEQFDKAADTFGRWLELAGEKATPTARFTIGIAFAQAKRYDEALEQAKMAVDAEEDPPEPWLQLLMSVHFERGDNPAVEAVLKRLVVRYPKKIYWQQLAGIFAERKEDAKALAVFEIMNRQGWLETAEEIQRLAQMLMFHGVPTKAIGVLHEGLEKNVLERDPKVLELLASSYLYARETDEAKGILAEAAKKSDDGNLYIQLGRQQLRDAEFEAAAASVRRGINRGGIEKVGNAWLLLGSVYYNAERWSDALDAFRRAEREPESQGTARRWISATEQQLHNAQASR